MYDEAVAGKEKERENRHMSVCMMTYLAVFKYEKPTNVDNNTCALTHLPTHVWLVEWIAIGHIYHHNHLLLLQLVEACQIKRRNGKKECGGRGKQEQGMGGLVCKALDLIGKTFAMWDDGFFQVADASLTVMGAEIQANSVSTRRGLVNLMKNKREFCCRNERLNKLKKHEWQLLRIELVG